jgi:hypothetical protein
MTVTAGASQGAPAAQNPAYRLASHFIFWICANACGVPKLGPTQAQAAVRPAFDQPTTPIAHAHCAVCSAMRILVSLLSGS